MTKLNKITALGVVVLILSACGGNNGDPSPGENAKDRKPILTHWADNIIVPSYAAFKGKFDVMVSKGDAFATAPDAASLVAFRAAWVDAYAEWQKVELFEFGPADRYTLRSFFNIYPTDVNGIAANISDPSASLDLPASYTRQGFPALDYLINGVGSDDQAIVAYYTASVEGPKRTAYIKRLTSRMNTLLTNVITEWGTYRDTFISKTGLDVSSSTGLVVNAYVLYFERYIRTGKIGIPSGATVTTAGVPYPEKVEAFYKKDLSLALVKNATLAVQGFFNGKDVVTGTEGPSLASYLDALEAKDAASGTLLSTVIKNQFSEINGKLEPLSPNLTQQVQTNNQAMLDVYAAMQKMVRILKVDMTSAMSVTITYTDNDGD
ncbi:imelysin family protein [Fulvivirgaceae bacterium PWU4]|uniref:Imelysin family protein n=1 Tax=Chryseosolibacter histidini TaxID=2782349 RepID=A0AAP2GPH2_9BACT|nr:imelysin family protein [Chryseosolibacter histidini]MBT1697432.1 imelysin family protein [Chryseosolibacter histidini]